MLSLTDNARYAVQDIAARAGVPERGGLRIVESPEHLGTFELSLVAGPVPGDEVIESDGARVFVDPTTSVVLADQQLDATTLEQGTGFRLAPQD